MSKIRKYMIPLVIAGFTLIHAAAVLAFSSQGVVDNEGQQLTDVTTYAGSGEFGEANGGLTDATFRSPQSALVKPDGTVLVSDTRSQLIRQIKGDAVTTYAGITFETDISGFPVGGMLDGELTGSVFQGPAGLGMDAAGNIYVADSDNHAIRKISPDRVVSTLAGNGVMGSKDGAGAEASFNHPQDVAVTADGIVYVADTLNHAIRKIDQQGNVTTLNALSNRAIAITPGQAIFAGDYKDGSLAEAKFNEPAGLALDAKGNLYVSDTGNQRIRYIDFASGTVTTVAGSSGETAGGESIYGVNELYAPGDYADGPAGQALFNFPKGIAVTQEGGLVIADSMNHSIRYLLDGQVTTLAGDADQGNGKLNGADRIAQFNNPTDVALLPDGGILVVDSYSNTLRKIAAYQYPAGLPQDDSLKVVYNTEVVAFADAKPEIVNGRAMVPVSPIAEALGYTVAYTGDGQIVQLTKGDVTIAFNIGGQQLTRSVQGRDDVLLQMDVAPYIKESRPMCPSASSRKRSVWTCGGMTATERLSFAATRVPWTGTLQ